LAAPEPPRGAAGRELESRDEWATGIRSISDMRFCLGQLCQKVTPIAMFPNPYHQMLQEQEVGASVPSQAACA
jgi:hypothetical protein